MKRANRLMLVIGVGLAAISFIAVLAFGGLGQQPNAPQQIPDVPVVVAAVDLPLGTQITAEQLATTTKPQTEAADTFQNPADLVGKVVRRPIPQGNAIITSDFETTVSVPELVQTLQPGLRAMAIPLSRIDSVGALLQPGDYVDVLLSMEEADGINPVVVPNTNSSPSVDGSEPAPYLSIDDMVNNTSIKVVVQNVQVLAAMAATPTDPSNDVSPQATPQPDMVVLLAVSPQQAEVVRFAQMDGNISLVLRSPADAAAADVDTTGITLKQLVDQYGVLPPAPVTPVTTAAP